MKYRRIAASALSAVLMMSTVFGVAAEDALVGDVNCDASVDVADIISLKNAIMTEEISDEYGILADLDQSGVVDVGDILALKNIIMTGGGTTAPVVPPEVDPPVVDPPVVDPPVVDPPEVDPPVVDPPVVDPPVVDPPVVDPPEVDPPVVDPPVVDPPVVDPPVISPPENPVDGWNTVGETKFYYHDGEFYTGHHDIGDFKYYFDDTGALKSYAGVDVSSFQEEVDWEAVAAEGAEFAFLRVGGRYYGSGKIFSDDYFDRNAEQAYAAGIKVGAYFFSQAITVEEAIEEADFVLSKIEGHVMEYPIVFDVEEVVGDTARADEISKSLRTEIARAFCERIEQAGYYAMIYATPDWAENGLNMSKLTDISYWMAHYTDKPDQDYPYTIWQYSQYADVNGIRWGRVDMNIAYVDFAKVIREAGLNHLDEAE